MKRTLALVMSAFLLAVVVLGAIPTKTMAAESKKATIKTFEADTFAVLKGETKQVKFTARIESERTLNKSDVSVLDSNGNFITSMRDDGKAGDAFANDGMYTGLAKLSSNSTGIVNYHVQVGNVSSSSHSIKYYNEIKSADFDKAYEIWNKLEAYENELAKRSMTSEEIASAVYDYLMRIAGDEIATIKVENDKAFSFMFKSGIENYFEHFDKDCTETDYTALNEQVKELSYIGESAIGVWSPYYGQQSSFTLNYKQRAEAMQAIAGYDRVDAYYGADASVNSFKNFDKYGIIMIDSHGADYNGGGYICIPKPGSYDSQDVTEGHIVLSGSTVYMRGTFMQKYCQELPNSIIYIGICYGMAASNLYQPLINHGAGFVCGYDESVSFTYDGIMMDEFGTQLVSINTTTGLQNTAGEAFDEAVKIHGNVDTYSSSHAKFIYRGDVDVVASAKAVSAESIEISDTELTLYRNNTYTLSYQVTPIDANRCVATWSSSNPEAVSVTESGKLEALAAGSATITLTVTDTSVAPANVFTATCEVTVAGDMAVSGISIDTTALTLYTGTVEKAKAHVLPENATNQNLLYSIDNDEIATVDEDGNVVPKKDGNTFVTVTTEDGGFSGIILIVVKEGDLNAALNIMGGDLSFETTGSTPDVVSIDGRLAAKTTNKSNNSTSKIVVNAGTLEAGTILTFDWSVSSEAGYDEFSFKVNGIEVEAISGTKNWTTKEFEVTTSAAYVFTWAYEKDSSESVGQDCAWLDNVEIMGESIIHDVKFIDMDGSILSEQQVAHGQAAIAPEVPSHAGFRFLAWDYDYNYIAGDAEIHAIYREAECCIVTFVDYDGTVLKVDTVEIGQAATAPEVPERVGYTFIGWDVDFTNVTEDITVTAQYAINEYTVTYVDGLTEEVLATFTVEYGSDVPAQVEYLPHEGYTFIGWDHDGTNITADTTITAQYKINEYTVTFVDGLTEEVISTVTVEHGSDVEMPETAPEHEGYTFIGWDNEGKSITEDTTITAQYTADVTIGDVNGDGVINTADAVQILKHAAELIKLEGNELIAADANLDEAVNTADAVYILKYCAGLVPAPEQEK